MFELLDYVSKFDLKNLGLFGRKGIKKNYHYFPLIYLLAGEIVYRWLHCALRKERNESALVF